MLGKGVQDVPLHTNRQLVATRNRLHGDILLRHAGSKQALLRAGDQGIDDGRVPAGVHDGNAESRAYTYQRN